MLWKGISNRLFDLVLCVGSLKLIIPSNTGQSIFPLTSFDYSNEVLMKLFILNGQCNQIIARTCRKFNQMYPELTPMNERKLVRLQNNFIKYGSNLKAPPSLPKLDTCASKQVEE